MARLLNFILATAIVLSLSEWRPSSAGQHEERFSILCLGDILLVNEAERSIQSRGSEYPFRKIANEFLKYDFIFANLEAPVTERGVPFAKKAYSFRTKPEIALCIKNLKIDAVSLSNNHLMDYGIEGIEDTVSYLDALNIRHAGAGRNLAEARKPAVLTFGATRVYIFAYCNRPPEQYYALENRQGTAPLDIGLVREDISSYKKKNDVALVSLHWGIEQTHIPQSSQIRTAHEIIDSGADAVIGHHPHWPQGIEIYRGKPIIYSLGNLVNGYYNHVERDNIGVGLYFSSGSLEKIKVLPIAGQNKKIQFQPYLLAGEPAGQTLELIRQLSEKLGTRMEIRDDFGYIPVNQNNSAVGIKNESPAGEASPD